MVSKNKEKPTVAVDATYYSILYDIQLPNASQEMVSVNHVTESFMCKKKKKKEKKREVEHATE